MILFKSENVCIRDLDLTLVKEEKLLFLGHLKPLLKWIMISKAAWTGVTICWSLKPNPYIMLILSKSLIHSLKLNFAVATCCLILNIEQNYIAFASLQIDKRAIMNNDHYIFFSICFQWWTLQASTCISFRLFSLRVLYSVRQSLI